MAVSRTPAWVDSELAVFSLRHWDIGQHGVWGGLVAAERAALRRGLTRTQPAKPL